MKIFRHHSTKREFQKGVYVGQKPHTLVLLKLFKKKQMHGQKGREAAGRTLVGTMMLGRGKAAFRLSLYSAVKPHAAKCISPLSVRPSVRPSGGPPS